MGCDDDMLEDILYLLEQGLHMERQIYETPNTTKIRNPERIFLERNSENALMNIVIYFNDIHRRDFRSLNRLCKIASMNIFMLQVYSSIFVCMI